MPHDDDLITAEQGEVWRHLRLRYAGEANADARTVILALYNFYHPTAKLSDRAFRQICSDLVVHFGKPICTTASGGYFMALNSHELEHAVKDLESRGMAILARAKALRQTRPLEPQGRLF